MAAVELFTVVAAQGVCTIRVAERRGYYGDVNHPSVSLPSASEVQDVAKFTSIGERFDQVAAQHAAKRVIEQGGAGVTFSQLKLAADAIAWRVLELSGGKPARVAILFSNRIAAIGAMLGVLKAGSAYVPLDAADPDERIRLILKDSSPSVMVTDSSHLSQAQRAAPSGCEVINIDALRVQPRTHPLPHVDADALAYVFYTSGSTGQPKGVCQTQRNLQFFVDAYCRTLGIAPEDRLSMVFSLSFSASNMHTYACLLTGATLCSFDVREGVGPLAQWVEEQRITVLHTVPTVLRRLARGCPPQRTFASLRAVDLGGEALFAGDVAQLRPLLRNDCLLINHLGATEASVIAQHVIPPDAPVGVGEAVPVGMPPQGVRVTIERDDGSEASPGEEGSIVVHSPFLCRGYWGNDALTAAAFSDDPHTGWRSYRGGDRGRLAPTGELMFLGRRGSRIKLWAHSIDLAEVESALRRCEGVRDAAVIVSRDEEGGEANGLIACVVAESARLRHAKTLRLDLAQRIPSYMVPARIVFLDALPQTATGKIDRQALENTRAARGGCGEGFEPPANDIEHHLAGLFEKLLDYSPAGRRDDFFEMGGDSLALAELNDHLVKQFGGNVPDAIEDATVAGLASLIQRNAADPSRADRLMPVLVPRRAEGTPPIMFLVHGGRGQAHLSKRFVELIGDDQPLYVFQARGVDGIQEPHKTIEAMAKDYISAMRAVQPRGPYFLAALCAGGFVALKMAHLLQRQGEQVGPLLLIDPPVPPFTQQQTEHNLKTLVAGLHTLERDGHIEFDFADANRRKGAVQVVVHFDRAVVADRPVPYDGPVYLLATGSRLSETAWGDPAKRKAYFTGDLRTFPIGGRHAEMLDPNNEAFARHLRECVQGARAAITGIVHL